MARSAASVVRVQIDETFIGGHKEGGQGGRGKHIVVGMMETGGKLATKVVTDRRSTTLVPVIRATVKPHSEVHTDEHAGYAPLG